MGRYIFTKLSTDVDISAAQHQAALAPRSWENRCHSKTLVLLQHLEWGMYTLEQGMKN